MTLRDLTHQSLVDKEMGDFAYVTELPRFLVKHPLLVLELGFIPVYDPEQPCGFDIEQTVLCDRWLRHKQQKIPNEFLQGLFKKTMAALQAAPYKHLYQQRTTAERINSQVKALGIETPKVRNINSVINLNTLTYLVINARALRQINLKQARRRSNAHHLL